MAINLTYAAQATVLSQGLADVLNSSVVKDVVVACSEGHCLQAHRIILATFSPYFRQLLGVSNEPNPTILLPDITVSVMEILLEFMYTGNVRVKKNHVSELVEANKCLRITGLDEMLSKHVGSSLPPTKKQRIEVVSVPPAKPSSLFRPWDSPVQAPRPEYTFPWLHSLSSGMNSFSQTAPLSPSYMPFPRASVNILSNTMPFPMSTGMNLFSEITPNLSSSMSFPLTTGKEPSLASRMPWSISYGNPFLSDAAPVLPTSHSRPIEKPEELLSVTTVSFPTSFGEQQFPISGPDKAQKNKPKGQPKKNNRKYLVPGKERCDVCKSDFYNVAGHKTVAHGLLKKPIECCGNKFTTRKELKQHKKTHKY